MSERRWITIDANEARRERALTPDNPVLRGTAQGPDAFFQARGLTGFAEPPRVLGGNGLSSKESTPAMVKAVLRPIPGAPPPWLCGPPSRGGKRAFTLLSTRI